jgi:type IV pilus assembly protein PilV
MQKPFKAIEIIGNLDEKGLSILDVIIAASLLAVGILAVATMQITAIQGNTTSRKLTLATSWAQDRMEQLMALPYSDTDLNVGSNSDTTPPAGYTISWTVSNGTVANTKTIRVTVQWQNQGQSRSLTITNVKAQL